MEDDYDESEHVKETFAHFGRTYYIGNVMEVGLTLAVMQFDFLHIKYKEMRGRRLTPEERQAYEAEFDAFMAAQHALTLGNLVKRLCNLPDVPDDLKADFAVAKKVRDFLAHHFWRERDEQFMTRTGKDAMIAELIKACDTFRDLDQRLDIVLEPFRSRIGISQEFLRAEYAKLLRKVRNNEDAGPI